MTGVLLLISQLVIPYKLLERACRYGAMTIEKRQDLHFILVPIELMRELFTF
jgi:hypothetical protein